VGAYTLPDLCEFNVQVVCSMKGMGKPRIEGRKGQDVQENLTGLLVVRKPWDVTSNIQLIYIPAICCARYIDIYILTTYCARCIRFQHHMRYVVLRWYPLRSQEKKHQPPITLSREVHDDRSNHVYIKKKGNHGPGTERQPVGSRITITRNAMHLAFTSKDGHLRLLRPPALRPLVALGTFFLLPLFLGGEGVKVESERVGVGGGRFSICASGKMIALRACATSLAGRIASVCSPKSSSLSGAI
jgi:hypothetical protein